MRIAISGTCFQRSDGLPAQPLPFMHRDDVEAEGYGAYLNQVEDVQ